MSFSTDPDTYLRDALNKGYVGARIEQGVPVLDRDLNLLADLPLAMLRTLTADFIGDGVREGNDAFLVVAADADNDFEITGPGVLVVDGLQIRIPAPLRYSAQSTTPLTTPVGVREDLVYLDVLTEPTLVDQTDDTDLENRSDVGQQTSVRLMASWQVRVAEGGPIPAAPPGHRHIQIAQLTRAAGDARIVVNNPEDDIRPRVPQLQTLADRGAADLSALQAQVDALQGRVERVEARLRRQIVQHSWSTPGRDATQVREIATAPPGNLLLCVGHIVATTGTRRWGLPFQAIASRSTSAGATVIHQGGSDVYFGTSSDPLIPPRTQTGMLVSVRRGFAVGEGEEAGLAISSWTDSVITLALQSDVEAVTATVHLLII
jgi:hypothetical protein